jgi:hypothetical protein
MAAALSNSWARGFPLETILDKSTQGKEAFKEQAIEMSKIGVMKFAADGNPDIDTIHRLIKLLPMNFTAENTEGASPLQVPSYAFAPYMPNQRCIQDLLCGPSAFCSWKSVGHSFGRATLLRLSFET